MAACKRSISRLAPVSKGIFLTKFEKTDNDKCDQKLAPRRTWLKLLAWAGGCSTGIELLLHMPRNVFRHLEHGNLLLASKNSFEGIVSVDQRFFLRIL
jgi:hypothetical protein